MRPAGGGLLLLAYVAFVSLGLPDAVLGVAWPSVRDGFGRAQGELGVVVAAGVAGYFLSSAFAGGLARRFGLGRLLAGSSAMVAVGLAAFAVAPGWWAFVAAAPVMGLGSGAIDAAINAWAARHLPARHVNWLHGFWSVGATIGPAVMTTAIAGLTYRAGYAALAVAIAALALAFALTRRAWNGGAASEAAPAPDPSAGTEAVAGAFAVLRRGRVWLQIAIFFLYTGVESATGAWCFTILREGRGVGLEAAGAWTAAYWASHTVGRFVLGSVVDRLGPDRLLRVTSLGAALAAAVFAANDGLAGRLGLVALGASFGPFFPTLMSRTPARLGHDTAAHAVGFQVSAATLGTAAMPAAAGLLATWAGVEAITIAVAGAAAALVLLHELLVTRSATDQRLAGRTG